MALQGDANGDVAFQQSVLGVFVAARGRKSEALEMLQL